MAKISSFRPPPDLSSRRAITVEVPEFLLRAFECRLAEANAGASEGERLDLEHLIEIQLADGLTVADLAHLEREVPGIGAAVSRWLAEID
jgi:hypothetical protein